MRLFLTYIVPLLLPLALYVSYILVARRVAAGQGPLAAQLRALPWMWLAAAGVLLLGISLLVLNLTTGSDPNRPYVPPHMENGEVVPGRVE